MKVFVATILVCVLVSVQAEIGFSLNGTFNPGFTIGSARRRDSPVNEEDNQSEWPKPDTINHFPVPESFTNVGENVAEENVAEQNDADEPQSAHGRNAHGHRRHHHN